MEVQHSKCASVNSEMKAPLCNLFLSRYPSRPLYLHNIIFRNFFFLFLMSGKALSTQSEWDLHPVNAFTLKSDDISAEQLSETHLILFGCFFFHAFPHISNIIFDCLIRLRLLLQSSFFNAQFILDNRIIHVTVKHRR